MIEAKGLSKSYGSVQALHELDLEVRAGGIYCLLGANGAGKTTTLNLFLGFIQPTSGMAAISGVVVRDDPVAARRQVAYIPETVMLYGMLSGVENLDYFAKLSGCRHDQRALRGFLQRAGLAPAAHDRPLKTYSKGMRQKVGVAIALARNARALLLDEPTSGLDPKASNEFSELIAGMARDGAAILMATHDLFRARETGTHIGIMRDGVLRAEFVASEIDHVSLENEYLKIMKED
ncbi:MAG: ABC transporter ATP-binding protein [Steroidobacteraceae bacterium]|jgi:ABC-2 type transport system ATP-binding protein